MFREQGLSLKILLGAVFPSLLVSFAVWRQRPPQLRIMVTPHAAAAVSQRAFPQAGVGGVPA